MMTCEESEFSFRYRFKVGIDVTRYEDWQEPVEEIIPVLDNVSIISLGIVDYTMPSSWMTNIYTFPPGENELDISLFKQALKSCLELIPALSGRLKNPSGSPYDFESPPKNLHIELGTTGVLFTSQKAKFTFNEIESNFNSPESTLQPMYLFQAAQREILNSASPPLLAVKVLESSDSGYILTVMRNHLVVDGRSNNMLLKMWSQFYRKEAVDPVIDNRSLYTKTSAVTLEAQNYLSEWAAPKETFKFQFEVQTVKFSISKSDMLALKQSCSDQYESKEDWISSDDLLSVIVWKVLMRACKYNQNKRTTFQRVVDIRKASQLPSNSYGNGVLMFNYPAITIQQLLETPLAKLALFFRQKLQEVATPIKVNDFLIALSYSSQPYMAARFLDSCSSPNILASSNSKFNPGDIHFHEPATTSLRCPYLPGRLFANFPTSTHYEARMGVLVKNIPDLLEDSDLKNWKIKVEVTSPPMVSS